ncbi:uncharacterized protein LOC132270480 [Cornus florida]|uniref:uncharacterized protein LOC132270480 n=1 Tax=Cornus florida TaxID=4283 RepID=UPI0028A2B0E9|nr:uncharacterized protein LOC132270480 [Cornus florida]
MASFEATREVHVKKKEQPPHQAPAASDLTQPEEAFADGESDPKLDTGYPMDAASKQHKEQGKAPKKDDKDDHQTLKSAVIISGIVVAVIGAIFAIVKKLKGA